MDAQITKEQAEFLAKLTEGQKLGATLAKPLWTAVVALVALVFGVGGWWANYQTNATEGSPAFKAFVRDWSDKQNQRDLEQAKINEKLTTLIEQMDKRVDKIEQRINK